MKKYYLAIALCFLFSSAHGCSVSARTSAVDPAGRFAVSFKEGLSNFKSTTQFVFDKDKGITQVQTLFHQAEDSLFESAIETVYTSAVDNSVTGLTDILNRKLFTDSTKSVGTFTAISVQGLLGLRGTAVTSTSTIHTEVFASGKTLYQMTVIIKNTNDQGEAQTFFDSFKWTE
jgi:hypothetical protein